MWLLPHKVLHTSIYVKYRKKNSYHRHIANIQNITYAPSLLRHANPVLANPTYHVAFTNPGNTSPDFPCKKKSAFSVSGVGSRFTSTTAAPLFFAANASARWENLRLMSL